MATTLGEVVQTDWRRRLPVLYRRQVVLRELRPSDAPSLFSLLTVDEVARFISPPPPTVAGFERFIAWTGRQTSAGAYVCFGVGSTRATNDLDDRGHRYDNAGL